MNIKPMDLDFSLFGMFSESNNNADFTFCCAGDTLPSKGFISINVDKGFSLGRVARILIDNIYHRYGVKVKVMLSDPLLHGNTIVRDGTQLCVGPCVIMRNGQTINVNMNAHYSTKVVLSLMFNFDVTIELAKEDPLVTLKIKEHLVQEIDMLDRNTILQLSDYHKDMSMMVLLQHNPVVPNKLPIPVFASTDKDRDIQSEDILYTLRVNKIGRDYVVYARLIGVGGVPLYTLIPYREVTLTMISHMTLSHSVGLAIIYSEWLAKKLKSLNQHGISKLKDMDSAKGVMGTPIAMFYKQIVKEVASADGDQDKAYAIRKQSTVTGFYEMMLRQLYHPDINKALYTDWVTIPKEEPQVIVVPEASVVKLSKYLSAMSPDIIEEAILNHLRVELNANEAKHRTAVGIIAQLEAVRDSMKDDLKTYTENITQQIDNIDKDIAAKYKTLPIFDTTAEQIRALLGPEYQPKQGE